MCSDEDEDDKNALLYLPISPEIEDIEESHAADQQVTDYCYMLSLEFSAFLTIQYADDSWKYY